jgi:hypothetical protein
LLKSREENYSYLILFLLSIAAKQLFKLSSMKKQPGTRGLTVQTAETFLWSALSGASEKPLVDGIKLHNFALEITFNYFNHTLLFGTIIS